MPVSATKTLASVGQSKYASGYNDHASPTAGVTFVNRGTIGIGATQWGAIFYGIGNTVQNYGLISTPNANTSPNGAVAFANANNVLYNHVGGTIGSGYEFGVYTANDPVSRADNCTVINAGLIFGGAGRYSIDMTNSGIVTNLSTGTISHGIVFFNGYTNSGQTATSNVSVVNSGTILGVHSPNYNYAAIYGRNGGAVTNLAGTIAGNTGVYGIRFANANALNAPGTVEPDGGADRQRRERLHRLLKRRWPSSVALHIDVHPPDVDQESLATLRREEPCLNDRVEHEELSDRISKRRQHGDDGFWRCTWGPRVGRGAV